MSEYDYDLIVIGGGPAGYVAALRATQLGLRTACIDRWRDPDRGPSLGGTCLNAGCIPSKALLETSHHYARLRDDFAGHGILVNGITLDLAQAQARKQAVVKRLTQGIATLFSAQGVEWLKGHGLLLGPRRVGYTPHGRRNPKELSAEHIILAPGSHPSTIETAPVDGEYIVDSDGALNFTEVPKRLAIVGAGVIGLELGSVWRRFGAEVLLLEAQNTFLPIADAGIARMALKSYTAQGLRIRLGARVKEARVSGHGVKVQYLDADGEQQERFDRLIVAVGRRPNTSDLYSDDSGLQLDERRFIGVDAHCRTNLPGVWAIGDAVRGPMLAHKGSEEGVMVVERIAGGQTTIVYDHIPSVIYTQPEFAWVGPSEEQLKQTGVPYRCGRFPMAANGRALAQGDAVGEVKLLAHAETDRLLAAHLFTPDASELIAQAMITLSLEGSAEDLARTLFAHPSLSEAVHEAALDMAGRALHLAKPKR
ncbi:dihydrolipoyl dehydrogenase [Acidihalobacter yilgarnensis]|uniref:Dihydrolipoyl dehydrogenase n=1 Tax=Acidihalobacter yilgarnensis TaxID=2819280 RepID=A0A1D8IJR1_9GAMM|nr:dihydrolipoyl dehydrogenase [Acidihalobacter yilgarnensis]AOU96654.1 dihydrolipoyl dehydrogenase [Acidihalobacter yilgarnensis]